MRSRNRKMAIGVAAAVLILFLLSLFPILRLAPYTGPLADDFGYGAPVHYAVVDGLGISGVLKAIGENIAFTYEVWQGTFSSVLLFSIQPGAFSDELYVITPFLTLTAIILPVFLALGTVRGMERSGLIFLGSVLSLLCVQYLPSPGEGIFWWNGAAHYMAFWCLGIALVRAQVKLSRIERRSGRFWLRLFLICLGAFLVGGGNYSTALVFSLISLALTAYAVWSRQPRPVLAAHAAMTVSSLAGLLISAAASGNSVRQDNFVRMGAVEAVLRSFLCAVEDIFAFTDGKMIGALLLCIPVFLYATRESPGRYRCPLLILAGSFCAFAALYTPFLFATGSEVLPGRMRNLIWLAYLFLLFGNAFYLAGWARRRWIWKGRNGIAKGAAVVCTLGAAVLALSLASQWQESAACLAWDDMASGRAAAYRMEREEREAVLRDRRRLSPRFQPIAVCPDSFLDARLVTWSSDLLINGVPSELPIYHTCGGEVTYVGLDSALACFGETREWTMEDFSHSIHMGREVCVPLRELVERLGCAVSYDTFRDTVSIETG